jgi:AraC-like DNA-binding protein
MSMKSMDWVQGPWSVQLHTVSRTSYHTLDIANRSFPHWIISYVKEGSVTTTAGGESRNARAGDVMLHPPHLPFSETSHTAGTHLWMQVTVLCSHHFDLLQIYRISPVITVPDPARYETIFQKLLSDWENRALPFRELKLTSSVLQLTEQLLAGWEQSGCPERPETYDGSSLRFAKLIGHMSMRLHHKIGREELAAYVRLNANYMDRAFQRQYGLTPMMLLRDMRLHRCKQLLEQTDDTLDAIAGQCGMSDASYLCKQFKKHFGMLPGEYRETVRRAQTEDLYGNARLSNETAQNVR